MVGHRELHYKAAYACPRFLFLFDEAMGGQGGLP